MKVLRLLEAASVVGHTFACLERWFEMLQFVNRLFVVDVAVVVADVDVTIVVAGVDVAGAGILTGAGIFITVLTSSNVRYSSVLHKYNRK